MPHPDELPGDPHDWALFQRAQAISQRALLATARLHPAWREIFGREIFSPALHALQDLSRLCHRKEDGDSRRWGFDNARGRLLTLNATLRFAEPWVIRMTREELDLLAADALALANDIAAFQSALKQAQKANDLAKEILHETAH